MTTVPEAAALIDAFVDDMEDARALHFLQSNGTGNPPVGGFRNSVTKVMSDLVAGTITKEQAQSQVASLLSTDATRDIALRDALKAGMDGITALTPELAAHQEPGFGRTPFGGTPNG